MSGSNIWWILWLNVIVSRTHLSIQGPTVDRAEQKPSSEVKGVFCKTPKDWILLNHKNWHASPPSFFSNASTEALSRTFHRFGHPTRYSEPPTKVKKTNLPAKQWHKAHSQNTKEGASGGTVNVLESPRQNPDLNPADYFLKYLKMTAD